jgi:hypothetical protein
MKMFESDQQQDPIGRGSTIGHAVTISTIMSPARSAAASGAFRSKCAPSR